MAFDWRLQRLDHKQITYGNRSHEFHNTQLSVKVSLASTEWTGTLIHSAERSPKVVLIGLLEPKWLRKTKRASSTLRTSQAVPHPSTDLKKKKKIGITVVTSLYLSRLKNNLGIFISTLKMMSLTMI